MPDLFSTLFKWAHRQDENFLTDSFTFLLNRLRVSDPEMGRAFLGWLCFGDEPLDGFQGELNVTTQVTVEEGRPDIWVKGDDCLVLVEVKKDSGLGEAQLERYREILRKSGRQHQRLVLLTRYAVAFEEGAERPERHVRWSDVADRLRVVKPTCPVSAYLIGEFLAFLRSQVMTIERVGSELLGGTTAQRNLIQMLQKALELAHIPVYQRSASWDSIGYYLDAKQFWVGLDYQWPHLISFGFSEAVPDPVRFKALGWGKLDGGKPYFDIDLGDGSAGFLTLSADDQLVALTVFVTLAHRAAKQAIDPPDDVPPDDVPPAVS